MARWGIAGWGASLLASSMTAACAPASVLEPGEATPGGAATIDDATAGAYQHVVNGLDEGQRAAFVVGASFTQHDWVSAPASTTSRDGLGPLYNATRCTACHVRGGRGRPPGADEEMLSMLVRLSVPGTTEYGGPMPEPSYGDQLQPRAILGVAPEARTRVAWTETLGRYADGTPYVLRAPVVTLDALAYGPMRDDVMTSARVAQPLLGLGLLEAIAEADVVANADPLDEDRDGISGRASRVWDESTGTWRLGRFGWKASTADVRAQTAAALSGDMGITSAIAPEESCTRAQASCAAAPTGGALQASDPILDAMVLHQRALAVPARRDATDPVVLRGRALFHDAGCADCHVPSFTTGASDLASLSRQRIFPYTDLLLHDMGPGLADGRPDHDASGSEWRTPPLWGLGLSEITSGSAALLHDGRARDVDEAILWHDGEAEAAREAFRAMSATDRDALTRFVRSL